ncbi:MAG: glycosyltransferase family 2 protein [Bacteroidetes bacterium]|nr:glycosyltransferase family 2 protein [Bacteroidota bacterium]
MLSILIPVFNFDIRPLVAALHGQCERSGAAFEILCFDDGSTDGFKTKNREIWKHTNLIYKELPQNLGRSAIRNALGLAARFDYLLFMDCDSLVPDASYLQKYFDHLQPGTVVYGGRSYQPIPPTDPSLYFHWYYGRQREQTTAAQRSKAPYHSFMTNNFVIPRQLFLDILFDESLRQYGHEDTLFGLELARRKVPILHIDNPLEHIGLEPVAVFLEKTKRGVENLARLHKSGKKIETRLLTTFLALKKWGLAGVLSFVFRFSSGWMVKNLSSKSPNLRVFDFYKLGLLTKEWG